MLFKKDAKDQHTEVLFEIEYANVNEQKAMERIVECDDLMVNDDAFTKYREIIDNNNFRFLYDTAQEEYFYQRADPVFDGTIILDMICAKVIVIDEGAKEHHFVPENYGTFY